MFAINMKSARSYCYSFGFQDTEDDPALCQIWLCHARLNKQLQAKTIQKRYFTW